ncbi:TPA: 1-deoxy-D-xylulose-5-phosphate reductoisomerase [Candidatus Galligastranaerophilus intestinavium]|uniref:1-deoxy-D-xylulose 5-phosphate reductoisomerase n=1 Tax=Candidatus Galligastranaerophilus intestinavium TaxID=2840836 RepID=A0A9D1FJX3_9BACT|nr:1-deoxy-D-xylulose-5-phosphate reductoisomerase [Candidatus Galligastranaerophilus intestinavium]
MKKITLLGSTGSIGTQALEVLDYLDEYEVLALAAGKNVRLLCAQIEKYRPKRVCIQKQEDVQLVKSKFPQVEVLWGLDGLMELCSDTQNDIILVATSGKIGLKPTLRAIENKINIALANKETLVMAGEIVMKKAKENNVKILPVDSEHSAILQCLSDKNNDPYKLIITASGGPFLNKTREEMGKSNALEALKHPRWHMGRKITIDSATLMNKGLEVIEAHYLFNMDYKDIKVVIHPQSLVHSFVEFIDGSMLAQVGFPSMHIPIQYALTYPKRHKGIKTDGFSLFGQTMTFEKPDLDKFRCLKMAYEAGLDGTSSLVVLNAANEVAVNNFLEGKIHFLDIEKTVEKALLEHNTIKNLTIDEILELDLETRKRYAK